MEDHIPFRIRYNRIRMETRLHKIEEERSDATCINRRIQQGYYYTPDEEIKNFVHLNFYKEEVLIVHIPIEGSQKKKGWKA